MEERRKIKDRRKKRFGRRDLFYIKLVNFVSVTPERLMGVLIISILALMYMTVDLLHEFTLSLIK